MKKALSFILAFILVFALVPSISVFAVDEDDTPAGGAAIAINTAEDFYAMNLEGNYYLAADITVDTTLTGTFTGTFDGKGHSITTSVILFEEINATVSDLVIKGAITTSAIQYVGALAGTVKGGTYTKITNEANIENTTSTSSGYACAGGLFGYLTIDNTVTVVDCTNKGTIHSVECAAGIIADTAKGAKAVLTGCTNTADITGDTNSTGGIFGLCESNKENKADLKFTDCTNSGTIKSGSDSAGGICAYGQGWATMTFVNCVNTGNVSSDSGKYNTGGILGDGDGVISFENCTNSGNVSHGASHAGGIVGEITDSGTFKNCFNSGEITGAKMAAGIAGGVNLPYFEFCGNTGKITAGSDTGSGILSYSKPNDSSAFLYCFNTGDISGKDCVTGIGGYFNSTSGVKFIGCYNTGMLTVLDGSYKTCALYYSNYSEDLAEGNVKGCFYIEGCAEFDSHFKPEGDSYTAVDAAKSVTAADVASGKLCAAINEAVEEEVFFQAIGTDGAPVLEKAEDGSNSVIKNPDGTYTNPVKEPETTLPEVTEPEITDPGQAPAGGDSAFLFIAVALVSVIGVAIVAKKREN